MRRMAGRAELVDAIAGFSLFADLTDPQLTGIVHIFEEAMFAEGERVLRQGLTGSGFHVILDGEAAIVIDGTERARLARGDYFGEISIILGESPIADVVALRPLRCLVLAGATGRGFPGGPPAGHVPDAPGPGSPVAGGEPMAELIAPFPPGDYPVVVIGSGPGAIQVSYSLRHLGVAHAVDLGRSVAGRHVPPLAVPPAAPVVDEASCARSSAGRRAYERYDWNSLLGEEPETRALQPGLMDGIVVLPVATGDGGEPRRVRRTGRDRDPLQLPLDRDAAASPVRPATGSWSKRQTGPIAARPLSSRSGSPSRTRPRTPGWS